MWLTAVAVRNCAELPGAVLCGPGGLKRRGVRGACTSMPNGPAVGRARVQFSRWAWPYPRGRCGERGYPAQRPRAGRGLSTNSDECGRGASAVAVASADTVLSTAAPTRATTPTRTRRT